jgi:arylsulfatase A-like enzyme
MNVRIQQSRPTTTGAAQRLATICLQIGALGALTAMLAGGITGARFVAQQRFLEQGLRHLAADGFVDRIHAWSWLGFLSAVVFVIAVAGIRPVLRQLREQGGVVLYWSAVAALLLLPVYLGAGWYVNRYHLPAFRSTASFAGNLGISLLALLLWSRLTLAVIRRRKPSREAPSSGREDAVEGAAVEPGMGPRSRGRFPVPLRWAPVVLVVAALAGLQGLRWLSPPSFDGPRTNVLIIVVDALRPDRLSSFGYARETSPHIDALAADGWRYTQAVSPAAWTKPSIASLLTSLYPRQLGIGSAEWGRQDDQGRTRVNSLPAALPTLAELMANAGYRTGAFGRNRHLAAELGFAQGYDTYEWQLRADNTASKIHRHFLDWLDTEGTGFFAYLHHIDVHWPYAPPPPFRGLYAKGEPLVDYNDFDFWDAHRDSEGPLEVDPQVLQHMSDAYDECVRFVDEELGSLFAALKERGLYDGTLIILTADHGEAFLEHGQLSHGSSLYDVQLRVPLIIKFPCPGSLCSPRVIDDQVELLDLAPTVLGVVGADPSSWHLGHDLTSPEERQREVALAELGNALALRTRDYKYIHNVERDDELFDIRQDPEERENILEREPELAVGFRQHLDTLIHQLNSAYGSDPEEVVADEEMLETLRGLGYVQ